MIGPEGVTRAVTSTLRAHLADRLLLLNRSSGGPAEDHAPPVRSVWPSPPGDLADRHLPAVWLQLLDGVNQTSIVEQRHERLIDVYEREYRLRVWLLCNGPDAASTARSHMRTHEAVMETLLAYPGLGMDQQATERAWLDRSRISDEWMEPDVEGRTWWAGSRLAVYVLAHEVLDIGPGPAGEPGPPVDDVGVTPVVASFVGGIDVGADPGDTIPVLPRDGMHP